MGRNANYSPEWVADYYDEYGEKEWDRLAVKPADRINFIVHAHHLREHIRPGSRVLEIGAGPGRFTQVLAALDCRVVVGDISNVQLELHRKHSTEQHFSHCVEDRLKLDICDLSVFASDAFDAVVCYGGPLSYVFEKAATALGECVRVCTGGGKVLASVMSLWGACHRNLEAVLQLPPSDNRKITATGDLIPGYLTEVKHRCHMFRSQELKELAVDAGLQVVAMSAANYLSVAWDEQLSTIKDESEQWRELVRMEIEASSEPGCLDAGTHIILVGRK
jgi:SAM-dependent methyltransferase